MIKTFVKKPVEVQAVQWTGENIKELSDFMDERHPDGTINRRFIAYGDSYNPDLVIFTLEGNHHATVGDWIIRGISGEFYPCKPDIFEKTYEEENEYVKRFIVFTNDDLNKIKSDEVVTLEMDSKTFYCVSENWMKEYDSTENLP